MKFDVRYYLVAIFIYPVSIWKVRFFFLGDVLKEISHVWVSFP